MTHKIKFVVSSTSNFKFGKKAIRVYYVDGFQIEQIVDTITRRHSLIKIE